ncbi:MAG: DUF3426 domain-containing protein [Pseudomonadota bacterium]
MANRTQCPKCFTTFLITDEQFSKSKGKVRCGNCRSIFYATFLPEEDEPTATAADASSKPDLFTREESRSPEHDDARPSPEADGETDVEAEAEEATKNSIDLQRENRSRQSEDSVREERQAPTFSIAEDRETSEEANEQVDAATAETESPSVSDFFDPLSRSEQIASVQTASMQTVSNDGVDLSEPTVEQEAVEKPDLSEDSDSSQALNNSEDEAEQHSATEVETEDDAEFRESRRKSPPSQLALPEIDATESELDPPLDEAKILSADEVKDFSVTDADEPSEPTDATSEDQNLISEVDQLIDEKLLIEEESTGAGGFAEATTTTEIDIETMAGLDDLLPTEPDQPLQLDGPRSSALRRWLLNPLLLLMGLVLLAGLVYQLWLRQALPILDQRNIPALIEPFAEPALNELEARFDVALPVRRDLKNLGIMSARTEAHPTRSSTTLLRVSIVNRSEIAQPFPWLELTLSDENGRLVARRALSPEDYLHNNRLDNMIPANGLQQVTIELLSFPRQAHGFELRLLSK